MKKNNIENRLVNTAGEGEVEMNWESRIETYTLSYVKQIANGKSIKELILSNCGARKDSRESLGQQGDQTSQSWKEIHPEYSLEGLILKFQYFVHLM